MKKLIKLKGDASFRKFFRKKNEIKSSILVFANVLMIKSGFIFIEKHYSGTYQKILKFLYLSSRILEYTLLSPFSKQKRLVLYNLIFDF